MKSSVRISVFLIRDHDRHRCKNASVTAASLTLSTLETLAQPHLLSQLRLRGSLVRMVTLPQNP